MTTAAPRPRSPLAVARPTESTPRRSPGVRRDPLGPVLALGRRALHVGAIAGFAGTLTLHGAAMAPAARSFYELRAFAQRIQAEVELRYRSEVDIDHLRPPPPPPPPPPPEPEPPKEEPKEPPRAAPEAPPPAPAQAGKLLTAEPDPDAPVDLTDQGFVTGTGDSYVGGVTAADGTSKGPVRAANATREGVPGGTGTGTRPVAAAPAVDRSRPAKPTSKSWDCPFPPEADLEGIHHARVMLTVTIGPDGRVKSVTVLNDPGHGFGRYARQCALGERYSVGLDRDGRPTATTTPPFAVTFNR